MKKLGIWISVLLILAWTVPGKAFAAEAAEVLIPVTVLAEGSSPDPNALYTVELIPQTPGCPMPEGSEGGGCRVRLKSGKTAWIRICCDALGVYDYTIRQAPGEDPDCSYDSCSYRLRLIVTAAEDGSKVVSALLYGEEETKVPEARFQNRWADPVYVTLSALKTMDGKTPEDGAFSFRLYSETGELLFEASNQGRYVTFPDLRFDQEGIYRYFLKEAAGTDGGILYDRAVYTITVEVTKDTDYRAGVAYERNGKAWSGIPVFRNYTDTGTPKTGDDIGIFVTLLWLSAAALAALFVYKRRKQ